MANRNFPNSRIYSGHVMPVLLDCNFVVDSTNGNGLGIRNLKGPMVSNVFMSTSATPLSGNPNPSAGTIIIQLSDKYNRSFSGFQAIVSPVSGTPILVTAPLVAGTAYIIVALGTTTAANWTALGVPIGVTPAVGVSFIATSASGAGTGTVEIPAASGSNICTIETVGDPNLSIDPSPQFQTFGAQFILQCRNYSGAITAPANGSVISLALYLSNSSILVQGE
jgi:hypothetical protein